MSSRRMRETIEEAATQREKTQHINTLRKYTESCPPLLHEKVILLAAPIFSESIPYDSNLPIPRTKESAVGHDRCQFEAFEVHPISR
jgi:hypothetical protein